MDEDGFTGRVYKITCDLDPDLMYIGSTERELSSRMSGHRYSASIYDRQCPVHAKMCEVGEKYFKIELLEEKWFKNQEEMRKLEQEWIDKLKPSLNAKRAYLSPEQRKQYLIDYEQKRSEGEDKKKRTDARREEREKNILSGRYRCEICDHNFSSFSTLQRHIEGDKHKLAELRLKESEDKNEHFGTGPWRCDLCNFKTDYLSHWKRHIGRNCHILNVAAAKKSIPKKRIVIVNPVEILR